MQAYFCIMQRIFRTGLIANALAVIFLINACGQPGTVAYEGDVNKQRLLLHVTSQYILGISQGQIDRDSSLLLTSKLYGLSPFLIYSEGYTNGQATPGTLLLDDGKVGEATALLSSMKEEGRLQLLLELGAYYVFKPGNAKNDLNEAQKFIQRAITESDETKSPLWKIESLRLYAFFLNQSGQSEKSLESINQAIQLAEKSKNKRQFAQTQIDSALLLPVTHPSRMAALEKAHVLVQSQQAYEKECEVIGELTTEYFLTKRMDKAEEFLLKNLEVQQQIGYKHSQYCYDVLAYLFTLRSEHKEAVIYANKSLECLATKSDSVFAPFFHARIGVIYMHMNKNEESLQYFDKALVGKTKETRLFWYKAFLQKVLLYNYMEKPTEALALIDETGREFPPTTLFEMMYFTISKGSAYYQLKQFEQAETYYNNFLAMSERFPPTYIHSEFPQSLLQIARFYCEIKKTQKARSLLEIIKNLVTGIPAGQSNFYQVLFKIDSTEKKYPEAMRDLQLVKLFSDSAQRIEQHNAAEELLVKYETEKKDKDILLLKQQSELQQAKLDQSQFTRNITFAGAALLLLIAGLLYYLYQTKKQSNTQLTHLLNEKEWLLKEIHHRVKNNLQTVLSLLESQSRKLSNEAFDAIQESQNRVYAMSLIHKKLYQSAEVSSINMEDYLRDLVQHLRDSFGSSSTIRFDLEFDAIDLDVSQAVPIGLIINEAITNSIKYAFPDRTQSGKINVSFKREIDNKIILLITDNGVGIAELKDNTQSLGLKLMRGLSDDIDGTFTIQSKPGVAIRIEFIATKPFQRLTEPVTSATALQPV